MLDIENFKSYLLKRKNSKGEIFKKSTVLLHYEFLSRIQKSFQTLDLDQIKKHLDDLYLQGRKGNYLNKYVMALHLYGEFQKSSYFDSLEFYPVQESAKQTMSTDEINAFLTLPPPSHSSKNKKNAAPYYPENYARWTLFYKIISFSGMRLGEVSHLSVDKVDFGRNVFILDPEDVKTNDFRLVPIAPALISDLREYIAKLQGDYLFATYAKTDKKFENPKFFNKDTWGYNFHERLKRLGIKRKNLTPNALRHSFITRLVGEDISIFKIKRIVGHKRTDTTEKYTHLVIKDLIDTMPKDPLARKYLSKRDMALQEKEALEKRGWNVVECRELPNGSFRLEIA